MAMRVSGLGQVWFGLSGAFGGKHTWGIWREGQGDRGTGFMLYACLQGREGGRRDTHARPPQRVQEASLELCLVSDHWGKGREGKERCIGI